MDQKFNREYRLQVDTRDGGSIVIGPPLSIEFDLVQSTLSGKQTLDLTVRNLKASSRALIRKDYIFNKDDISIGRQVEFWAGYSGSIPDNMPDYYRSKSVNGLTAFPTVFRGTLVSAYSKREGNTGTVTRIEASSYPGDNLMARSNRPPYGKGTPIVHIIRDLISDIPRVTVGAIGNFPGELKRANSYVGNPVENILALTGGKFFIYQQKAYCLNENEYIQGPIPLINASSGLIGSPQINNQLITIQMLFEPGLVLAQSVELESRTYKELNGIYRVVGLQHRGVISPTVCGSVITTVELSSNKTLANSLFTLVSP